MNSAQDMLDWIDAQQERMHRLVVELAQVNSGTMNLAGLDHVARKLDVEFEQLDAPVERIDLLPFETVNDKGNLTTHDLGQLLRVRKQADRSEADSPRVLLGIHYDTVYGVDHAFQSCTLLDANTLRGPGVADAKGGIIVMLIALLAFEQSPWASRLSWEVILNPDEEIGSPASAAILRDAATRHHFGIIFEPALASGSFAAPRKGSGNFTLVLRGKSVHAGRAFQDGRNAMHLLAHAVVELAALNDRKAQYPGLTVNVAKIEGGGPNNIVPDLAIARFNVRVETKQEQEYVESTLAMLVANLTTHEGFQAMLHGSFNSPPKPIDDATLRMLQSLQACGREMNLDLHWQPTGGVCDGNKLAAAGLPNVDTLGPRGGAIHSENEYLLLDSLAERAKLTSLFLKQIAERAV